MSPGVRASHQDPALVPLTAFERLYGWLSPCAFGVALLAARMRGASAIELGARTGQMPAGRGPLLWFHGASAGEMMAATRLVEVLHVGGFKFTPAYTTTNREGLEFLTRSGGSESLAALAPFDVSSWIGRAMDHWQPKALFLVETELWPRLILEAQRRCVPTFSVSARIYSRDLPRYRLVRGLIAPALRRLTAILAQNEAERERFIALGAAPERCVAAGNLKYLGPNLPSITSGRLRSELKLTPRDKVVVFGSIHQDEVSEVFKACDQLSNVENLRFIIAPRHRSGIAPIIRHSLARGWRLGRRTAGPLSADWRVLMLDTMGELKDCYALACVAVVGGGLCRHGGHNPLEPVICGAPVIYGIHLEHFESEARALRMTAPEAEVSSSRELGERLRQWLNDRARRVSILELQRRAVPDCDAIAACYLRELSPWLEARCA